MNIKLIVALAAAVSLSGCASIIKGGNQSLLVKSGQVDSADCLMTGGSKNNVNQRFTTPAEVKVPRSGKALKFECTKPGYRDGIESVDSSIEPWAVGNIVLGGPIGLGVDALTGALHKYPSDIQVVMERTGVTTPTVTGEPIM